MMVTAQVLKGNEVVTSIDRDVSKEGDLGKLVHVISEQYRKEHYDKSLFADDCRLSIIKTAI